MINKGKFKKDKIICLIKIIISRIIACFYSSTDIWLVSERGFEARDNGYCFFLFLKKNHPEINSKYVISKDSPDRSRLLDYENDLIDYGSWKHYMLVWRAKNLISTHIQGFTPNMSFYKSLDIRFRIIKGKQIFLQHGIIKDHIKSLFSNMMKLDIFCCGAKTEYDFICANSTRPDGVVQYTGLCRYDNLNSFTSKKQILVMPTWRMYIDKERFSDSEYYKEWSNFLTSESLHSLLKKTGYNLVFYPHFEVQPLLHYFKRLSLSDDITIAGFEFDVQTLLKESAILVTDFSSVYFDMSYMHKPIVFFQFDEEEFHGKHYAKGYINEEDLGYKTKTAENAISLLSEIISNGCKPEDRIISNMDKMFPMRDSNNCQRVYDAICRL